MEKTCEICGAAIPMARLQALPTTETCVGCSRERKVEGAMRWDGKHAPTLEVYAAGERPIQRRGFHAQLPFNGKNNPRMIASARNFNLSEGLINRESPLEPPPREAYDVAVSTVPASRCHPERPKAVPDGRCLECAVAYYSKGKKR